MDTRTHVAEGEAVPDKNPVLARRDTRRVCDAYVVFLGPGGEQEKGFDVSKRVAAINRYRKRHSCQSKVIAWVCGGVKSFSLASGSKTERKQNNSARREKQQQRRLHLLQRVNLETCHTVCHPPLPLVNPTTAVSLLLPYRLTPFSFTTTLEYLRASFARHTRLPAAPSECHVLKKRSAPLRTPQDRLPPVCPPCLPLLSTVVQSRL